MTLTMGRGPFGHQPGGRFNFDPPEHVVYVEDVARRIRGEKNGRTVVDSGATKLVWESRRLPYYTFPAADVDIASSPDPHVDGHVTVEWNEVDAWYEEDDQVFVHPRDPYHRIDTFSTARHVRVSLEGVVLAESTRAKALHETGLPIRYYLPLGDVRLELLEPSELVTACAYKGTASHWSARLGDSLHTDVAWCYADDVWREAEPVRGRIAFYNERTDMEIDGDAQERPPTPWAR